MKLLDTVAVITVSVVGVWLSGCGSTRPFDPDPRVSANPGQWAELQQTNVASGTTISVPRFVAYHGFQPGSEAPDETNVVAVIGPTSPASPGIATLWSSRPNLEITDGFAYITGGWPIVFTERVIASGYGTSVGMLVGGASKGDPHRVFFFRPKRTQTVVLELTGPTSGPRRLVLSRVSSAVYVDVIVGPSGLEFGQIVPETLWDSATLAIVSGLDAFRDANGIP